MGGANLNTQWNPTVQADTPSCRWDVGLREMAANTTKIENTLCQALVAHAFNPHALKAEADGSQWVWGQPVLQNEFQDSQNC